MPDKSDKQPSLDLLKAKYQLHREQTRVNLISVGASAEDVDKILAETDGIVEDAFSRNKTRVLRSLDKEIDTYAHVDPEFRKTLERELGLDYSEIDRKRDKKLEAIVVRDLVRNEIVG